MSKHIAPNYFYCLPSGAKIHPCRLIHKDGTLMWKHAMLNHNEFTSLPVTQAHEQHILKTAQRLEELNTWASQDMEPWDCIMPIAWYDPSMPELAEGICLYFYHKRYTAEELYAKLLQHIQPHEKLEIYKSNIPSDNSLFFKRC